VPRRQVAIAAVDLAEFRLQRTGQVQGIGRAEEHVRRQEGHPSRLRLHHCGSYRQGRPQAGVEIGFDLGGELPELPLRQALFPEVAVERSDHLATADRATRQSVGGLGLSAHRRGVRLREIELREVAGVEVGHPPSRIDAMTSAVSGPPMGRAPRSWGRPTWT